MTRVVLLMTAAVMLAACGGDGGLLDRGKRAPDEFAVYSRAPLTLPPDYGLRPPEPGLERAERTPREVARGSLVPSPGAGGYAPGRPASDLGPGMSTAGSGFGAGTFASPGSVAGTAGTVAILARSGASDVDPAIRAQVDRETAVLAEEDQTFTERLIFWGTPTEYGTVVDPVAESRRIKENLALGRTLTAGKTPTIERRQRAVLEGLFD